MSLLNESTKDPTMLAPPNVTAEPSSSVVSEANFTGKINYIMTDFDIASFEN